MVHRAVSPRARPTHVRLSGVSAPDHARRIVRGALGAGPEVEVELAARLASQLVAASQRYATDEPTMEVEMTGRVARVEVLDPRRIDACSHRPADPGDLADPSRRLLDAHAARWGVERRGTAAVTWFELDL
jgi:hypothetical protein